MQENGKPIVTILLPILPLVIFILVESVFGTKIGLITALILGVVEFIFTYITYKKLDKFIILDIALLSALGGVSLLFENDFFFLMKPAIFELVFAAILASSFFTEKNLLLLMMKRYIKKENPLMEKQLTIISKHLFFMLIFHSILILLSTQFFSHNVWIFVSTILLYILMGVYFAGFIAYKKLFTEILPLVDKDGNIIGKAPRDYCHEINYPYHPVVHLMITNSKGQFLLQKREAKKSFPLYWDTSVGGHISFGEELETALMREAREELLIENFKYSFIGKLFADLPKGSEIIYLFHANIDDIAKIKTKEVKCVEYFSFEDIKKLDVITPHLLEEVRIINTFLKKLKQ